MSESREYQLRFTNLSLSSRRTIYGQDDVADDINTMSFTTLLSALMT